MTKPTERDEAGGYEAPLTPEPPERRCRWCGRPLEAAEGPGRPRRFCRQGCRQQAHMARKVAAAHGLGPGDVIIGRDALEAFQGAVYCLQAALEDVERDLADAGDDPDEVRRALGWLVDNAQPVAALWIEPRTGA